MQKQALPGLVIVGQVVKLLAKISMPRALRSVSSKVVREFLEYYVAFAFVMRNRQNHSKDIAKLVRVGCQGALMTVTVEIPKEIEARIIAQAQASGVSLSEIVRDLLVSAWEHKGSSHDVAKERALAAGIRIRELRKGVTLDGLSIKDLINEGRL